ncbi:hypothetical protein ACB098_11G166900 [Castanea mollissima]
MHERNPEFAATRIQSAFRGLPCEFKEATKYWYDINDLDHSITYVDLGHFIRGGAAIIAQNIEEKSLDIYSFQRLVSDLINLLLEFQNVEATYCVLQHDDHWMCTKCHFKQILCLA